MSEVRLIDANALKAKIKSRYDNDDDEFERGYNIGLETAVDLIDSAQTVTPDMAQVLAYECGKASSDRPTGKWIKCDFHDFGGRVEWNYKCTNCEAVYGIQYNYCPDCGAKMKQEAENERT